MFGKWFNPFKPNKHMIEIVIKSDPPRPFGSKPPFNPLDHIKIYH